MLQAVDRATSEIVKVREAITGLGTRTKETTEKTGLFTKALTIASGVLIRDFARSLTQGIVESAKLGASLDTLRTSFERLVQITDATNLDLESLRKATRKTVSDVDLLASANRALALGLPADRLNELYVAAMRLGPALGLTVTQAIDRLSIGIGRQSKLVLDDIGVVFQAEEAYAWWAKQLGVASSVLDDSQKRLAWQEYAMMMITKRGKELGDVISDTQLKQEQWNASLKNFSTEIGRALGPLAGFIGVIEPFLPMLGIMGARLLPQLISQLGLTSKATAIFGSTIQTAAIRIGALTAAMGATLLILESLPNNIRIVVATITGLTSAVAAGTVAWMAYHGAMSAGTAIPAILASIGVGIGSLIGLLKDTGSEAEDVFDGLGGGIEDFAEKTENIIMRMKTPELLKTKLLEGAQGVVEAFQECTEGKGKDLAENFGKSMNNLVENTNFLIKSGLLGQAQDNIAAFVECSTSKQADMVDKIDEYVNDLYETYKDNTNKIVSYRKAGLEEEAQIYEQQNQEILSKVQQLEDWKQQIISEGEQQIQDIIGASTQAQLDTLQEYIEHLWEIGEIGLHEATYMAGLGLTEGGKKVPAPTPTTPVEPAAPSKEDLREAWKKTLDPAYLKYIEITEKMLGGMAILKHKYPEYYAKGGLVTRPTLAVLGEREPELVTPISQLRRSPRFFGGGDVNVTLNNYGDIHSEADENRLAEKVARKVREVQLDELRARWR